MTNMTKAQALRLVTKALRAGHTLKSDCVRGHITAGSIIEATSRPRYGCYLYTPACPGGEEIGWSCLVQDAALTFVDYCGRGTAGRLARAALEVV